MLFTNVNKIVSHVVVILIIYLLLRVIPKTPLENRDIVIATISLYIIFVIVNMTKEHLTETPNLINTQPMPPQQPMPPHPTVPTVEECNTCKVDLKNNEDVKKIASDEGMIAYTYEPKYKYPHNGSRMQDGIITTEMSYTDYNTLPLGANVNSQNSDFSYSFLPPDKWYPVPPHPPVCITEMKCPVCPVSSDSSTVDLKEWNDARRVTPGDAVNTKYLNEKLNSGR